MSSRQDYSRRNKNSNQKRFPAAAKGGGGGRGQQNYNHQPPQEWNSIGIVAFNFGLKESFRWFAL